MSDELTPEERKAIDSLPRERMPAGLEGRVVDAMRDHGFLAKRRRVIMLTNTRAAGVLAAGVALIVGAYSFGLHRGGTEDARRVFTELGIPPSGSVAPAENDELGRVQQAPAVDAVKPESKQLESQEERQRGALEKERSRANDAPAAVIEGKSEKLAAAPPVVSDESKKDLDWQLKPKAEARADAQKTVETPLQAEAPKLARSSDRPQPPQSSLALQESVQRPLTFVLNGKTVLLDVPDNVRVVEDEQGKAILIYTSDGVIRIRLSD
jgi:hypothetical protein